MTVQRHLAFWGIALIVLILLIVLFHGIMLPFVVGMALAYLFDPMADRLQRMRMSRLAASLVVLGLFFLAVILSLMLLVPLIVSQLSGFVEKLPATVSRLQLLAVEHGAPLIKRIGGPTAVEDLQSSAGDLVAKGAGWAATFLGSVWAGGMAVVNIASLAVVTPVVAFYMLMDWDRMVAKVDGWVPVMHRATVRSLARQIDRAIAGFLRGQALVCLFLGTFYAVGLSLAGLNFGALIGLTSGILSFIPYVGTLTGFVVSTGVAIVQFWPDWTMIAIVIGIFIAGQFVEGNILSPKLVGDAIGVHPVWLMFALFAFGSLFGFVGLLLAVPLAATAGVLARFALAQYLASPLHDDEKDEEAPKRSKKDA
jgi:predicted PurR-regulated permease PerM